MTRALALLLLLVAGGCDLFGAGCPPVSFGLECALIGEWDLDTVGGEPAPGALEVESGFSGFLSVPSGLEGCGPFQGPFGGSAPLDDVDEGPVTVRLWQTSALCEDDVVVRHSVDLNGRVALEGDRLTLTLRQDRLLGDGAFPLFREPTALVFSR